jgi:hypothetical protein
VLRLRAERKAGKLLADIEKVPDEQFEAALAGCSFPC